MSKLSLELVMEAAEADDGRGFCLACGAQACGVEPDAGRRAGAVRPGSRSRSRRPGKARAPGKLASPASPRRSRTEAEPEGRRKGAQPRAARRRCVCHRHGGQCDREALPEGRACADCYDFCDPPGLGASCRCWSGLPSFELLDARGIYCGRVCDQCERVKRMEFRPEIFSDSDYHTDEPVGDERNDW